MSSGAKDSGEAGKKISFNEEKDQDQHGEAPANAGGAQPPPMAEAPQEEAPGSHHDIRAHVHVDVDPPVTPHYRHVEHAILIDDEDEEMRVSAWKAFEWFCYCLLFLFLVGCIFAAFSADERQRSRPVIVRLPDDSGVVAISPSRNYWDSPRVVAVYRNQKQPKHTVIREKIIVREKSKKAMAPTPTASQTTTEASSPREKSVRIVRRAIKGAKSEGSEK